MITWCRVVMKGWCIWYNAMLCHHAVLKAAIPWWKTFTTLERCNFLPIKPCLCFEIWKHNDKRKGFSVCKKAVFLNSVLCVCVINHLLQSSVSHNLLLYQSCYTKKQNMMIFCVCFCDLLGQIIEKTGVHHHCRSSNGAVTQKFASQSQIDLLSSIWLDLSFRNYCLFVFLVL